METHLTKRIKELTHSYKPKLNTKMRTVRWADEVWTPSGIVDSIRFEDYISNDNSYCRFISPDPDDTLFINLAHKNKYMCKVDGMTYPNKHCHGCVGHVHMHDIDMMCTCYEVKISLSDFKSRNGHNFHGNENYYCVPAELVPKIIDNVPEYIGILSYYKGKRLDGLRMVKPAIWKKVGCDVMVYLLYNAMKKWCDGAVFLDK